MRDCDASLTLDGAGVINVDNKLRQYQSQLQSMSEVVPDGDGRIERSEVRRALPRQPRAGFPAVPGDDRSSGVNMYRSASASVLSAS